MIRTLIAESRLGVVGGTADRSRRRARVGVEGLEGRALLSTVQAATTSVAHAFATTKAVPSSLYAPVIGKTYPTFQISLEVNADSDPSGSGNVFQQNVLIDGYGPAYSSVYLAIGPRGYYNNYTTTDYTGHYEILLPVSYGQTEISAFAENPLQDYSTVDHITVDRGNAIVAWDSLALRAIRNADLSPAEASRDLAILHAAQYDAVAAVDFPSSAYQVHATAPKGASAEAAADSAANTVLQALFPAQAPAFQGAENAAQAGLATTTPAVKAGLALGIQVAQQTLVNRSLDGSSVPSNYLPSPLPGLYKPTPPSFFAAQDAQWGMVAPFLLSGGAQFRPAAPPTLNSTAYDQALQQVELLGRASSTSRTGDQTAAAEFWNDGVGTFTNPGHWNAIAEQFSLARKDSLDADARLFAQLDFAQADAAIATLGAAYTYNLWRPVTAIQQTDPSFAPLLITPPTPSYPSDHAAIGKAAADVLAATFGAKTQFTDELFAATGVTRTFASFAAAAAEDGQSRVDGGVNYSFDVTQGATLGDEVGKYDLAHFPKAK